RPTSGPVHSTKHSYFKKYTSTKVDASAVFGFLTYTSTNVVLSISLTLTLQVSVLLVEMTKNSVLGNSITEVLSIMPNFTKASLARISPSLAIVGNGLSL